MSGGGKKRLCEWIREEVGWVHVTMLFLRTSQSNLVWWRRNLLKGTVCIEEGGPSLGKKERERIGGD
jgi:hypothetical protein